MDNKTYVYKETGEEIAIEIVLSFKVEELNKSFIAYTLNDDGESDTVPIFISEYIAFACDLIAKSFNIRASGLSSNCFKIF